MDETIWPFAALRITTPMLELRYPDDDDLCALAHLAADGIHDPAAMPFYVPWTRADAPDLKRGLLQFGWGRRSSLDPDDWSLPFVVLRRRRSGRGAGRLREAVRGASGGRDRLVARCSDARVVGSARRCVPRCCTSRSTARRGRGAQRSFTDNPASAAVSRHNGYVAERRRDRRAGRCRRRGCSTGRCHAAVWNAGRRDDIAVEGLEACLPLLGAEPSAEAELVPLGVLHHDPAGAVAGSPLRGRLPSTREAPSATSPSDLGVGFTTREIDVHPVLGGLGLGHAEAEEVSHAATIRCGAPGEVVARFGELEPGTDDQKSASAAGSAQSRVTLKMNDDMRRVSRRARAAASATEGAPLRATSVSLRAEFTVEPFVAGAPGPHVLAAVEAATAARAHRRVRTVRQLGRG